MACEVNVTEVSRGWYEDLTRPEQDSVETAVNRLIDVGTGLSFPYSSGIKGSQFSRMRELRIQHQGHPYRVLYAFDPEAVGGAASRRRQDRERSLVRDDGSEGRCAVRGVSG
jgi:hypothetical protein